MKIGIVDTMSLSHGNNIYGHFAKVSCQYLDLLQEGGHDVRIIGHKIYRKYVSDDHLDYLPFKSDKDIFLSGSRIRRLWNKMCCLVNILIVLLYKKYDLLIMHDNNQNLFYYIYSILPIKRNIALIRYTYPKTEKQQTLFRKISEKVSFIITSMKEVGESYMLPYALVPDYFPFQKKDTIYAEEYDLCIVGTINECKDIETVIKSVLNSDLRLIIAGHFEDYNRYLNAVNMCKDSNNISITNSYLSDNEYDKTIGSSKFIVLPYDLKKYENRSSGVILDAVYSGKPVIATSCDAFMPVEQRHIGFLYSTDFSLVITKIQKCSYADLVHNVLAYKNDLYKSKSLLLAMVYNTLDKSKNSNATKI